MRFPCQRIERVHREGLLQEIPPAVFFSLFTLFSESNHPTKRIQQERLQGVQAHHLRLRPTAPRE